MPPRKKQPKATEPSSPDVATVDLGDLAEQFADQTPEEREPSSDLFVLDALKLAQLEKAGVDSTVVEVSVTLHDTHKGRITIPGRYPIEGLSLEEIARRWGPGIYELRGFNQQKRAVAYARHQLRGVAPAPAPATSASSLGGSSGGGDSFEREIMRALLLRMVDQQGGGGAAADPLRSTMAEMAKMMALQQQMALTALQAQQQISQANAAPAQAMQDRFLALVEKSINGKAQNGGGGFAEAMPILQLGMSLGQRIAGGGSSAIVPATDDTPKPPGWLEVVPEIADTVGVPLIVSLAQAFLPPDKAQQVLEAIGEHAKARQAEARAAEQNGGDGAPTSAHVDLG